MPTLRIPFTDPLPKPSVVPAFATTLDGAVSAVREFLLTPPKLSSSSERGGISNEKNHSSTVLLTGAGISVASGLADYRGPNGVYRRKTPFRPIFYYDFMTAHEVRQRYWARSFFGWATFRSASPNRTHLAIGQLGQLGVVNAVITQNVDYLHQRAHPFLPTIALHGSLPFVVCTSCGGKERREVFQERLISLNPAWAQVLAEAVEAGELGGQGHERGENKRFQTNADGDMDIQGLSHRDFKYPACLDCSIQPQYMDNVHIDSDGAMLEGSTKGVMKPDVVMFGQDLSPDVRMQAQETVDNASRMLIVGSSLATHSAWRLATQARGRNIPIGIINLGGVRGEEKLLPPSSANNLGGEVVRCELDAADVLEGVLGSLANEGGLVDYGGRPQTSATGMNT